MRRNEIKEIAMLHYVNALKSKKADLVRAIQRAEGNSQCFGNNNSRECGQDRCVWRDECDS